MKYLTTLNVVTSGISFELYSRFCSTGSFSTILKPFLLLSLKSYLINVHDGYDVNNDLACLLKRPRTIRKQDTS
jgi:hypothetical protein